MKQLMEARQCDEKTLGNPSGVFEASQNGIARARSSAGLVSSRDPMIFEDILDIYKCRLRQNGFQARLFDIPGMGHQDCSMETLEKVLNYLDTGR